LVLPHGHESSTKNLGGLLWGNSPPIGYWIGRVGVSY
jgi:hypothetical protein